MQRENEHPLAMGFAWKSRAIAYLKVRDQRLLFWTTQSGRNNLPNVTAALGHSKQARDILGGFFRRGVREKGKSRANGSFLAGIQGDVVYDLWHRKTGHAFTLRIDLPVVLHLVCAFMQTSASPTAEAVRVSLCVGGGDGKSAV